MISARNKARIVCHKCSGEIEVEAKTIGTKDVYNYCPLCGEDDIDVMIMK